MLDFEIITPEKVVVQEKVEMVEMNGSLGEIGILPGHIKFLTTVEIGEIRYLKDGKTKHIATSGGFGEVVDDKVIFLVETAEFAGDIDVDRAKGARERAESATKDIPMDSVEYKTHEQAMMRAASRLSTAAKAS